MAYKNYNIESLFQMAVFEKLKEEMESAKGLLRVAMEKIDVVDSLMMSLDCDDDEEEPKVVKKEEKEEKVEEEVKDNYVRRSVKRRKRYNDNLTAMQRLRLREAKLYIDYETKRRKGKCDSYHSYMQLKADIDSGIVEKKEEKKVDDQK